MGYDYEKWKKRFENRSDITLTLTHLTREQLLGDGTKLSSVDVLLKILKEQKIIGSTKIAYIHGIHPAVCFQESPQYGIAQNLIHETRFREELGGKIRYSSNGLIFLKRYVYLRGARPVIYENVNDAKKMLPEEEWWRIVSHNLDNKENIVDWTHEREWRVKGDFEFKLSAAYVLLGSSKSYKEFINKADIEILKSIAGITAIAPLAL